MNYTSTRDNTQAVSSAQAILRGISPEGGLYVPRQLPTLTLEDITALVPMDYRGRAAWVLSRFLTDFTAQELEDCIQGAYGGGKFDDGLPAPLTALEGEATLLELWHGPTCAFKDMALQLLPGLLTTSAAKCGDGRRTAILVATSGDTGKAALEGFKDIPGTRIQVFYPTDGVSAMQKRQMNTQSGGNVSVVAVRGNFDDCQTGVKAIFTSQELQEEVGERGYRFSSANSINWGRLVPQIVYYISAYCDLVAEERISLGDPINLCVPTGNFGNILAAYYARGMGLPVGKFICASNRNNVLTDFIRTGTYDRNRPFFATSSPSMDILVSSNLERLLYHLSGADSQLVTRLMEGLNIQGRYTLPATMTQALQRDFYGTFCDEEAGNATIRRVLEDYDYLVDPHTAVALHGARAYREATGDETPMVVVSTASPYKFAASVLEALEEPEISGDDFENLERLRVRTGTPVPQPLLALDTVPVRFTQECTTSQMAEATLDFLR